ncbi:hypothetical protein CLF_112011 [Clonorchis sinensis]|uniref:Uncharacterized protein n=1 Tax=Clonorchis sinensis TaxID=79923 RepID=G7YVP1_CLOSI|nr:hypothetical protein CLF_112011 [Clonorchis sinensis]
MLEPERGGGRLYILSFNSARRIQDYCHYCISALHGVFQVNAGVIQIGQCEFIAQDLPRRLGDHGFRVAVSRRLCILPMFRRVRALFTEEVDRRAAHIEVKKRLQDSGYLVGLIKRQLRRVLVPTPRPNKEWIGTAVIPYKTGTSEVIRRVLNTANIRVAFRKGKTLRYVLVHLKDHLPVDGTRNYVYRIKCYDCTKVYIGQTARELHTRVGEHKRSINRPPRNIDEHQAIVKDSVMAGHALDTGHGRFG